MPTKRTMNDVKRTNEEAIKNPFADQVHQFVNPAVRKERQKNDVQKKVKKALKDRLGL